MALQGFQHGSMLVVSEQHRLHTMARARVEIAVLIESKADEHLWMYPTHSLEGTLEGGCGGFLRQQTDA